MRMGQWPRLRTGIRDTDPGYFALVMATGIVSAAVRLDGAGRLAAVLLAAGVVAYALLVLAYGWRLAGVPPGLPSRPPLTPAPRCSAFCTFSRWLARRSLRLPRAGRDRRPSRPGGAVAACRRRHVGYRCCSPSERGATWSAGCRCPYEPGLWGIVFPVGMYGWRAMSWVPPWDCHGW